jgi:hypothetical protein
MNKGTVEELARVRGVPAVSILCPLDVQHPGNPHDPTVLTELRDRAKEQLDADVSGRVASSIVSRIDDALSALDLEHPSPGVAIFVSPDVSRIIPLDSPVGPEVVVGERFAIRGLLKALQQRPRARVVVLSQAKTRCIDLDGALASERLDFGFPLEVEPPVEADTPQRDFPLDEHEHDEAAKFVFRAVDHALGGLQHRDGRPLVLLGAERDLAYFDEITTQRTHIIGRLHGNYERKTAGAIADLVQPVLDAHELEQQQQACTDVREAIGSCAVAGIAEAWAAARAGRGHRLVVEDAFRYPARVVGEMLEPARDNDPGAKDAVEDTIEEVVRHGGDVVGVPGDSLADVGRIALVTRY